MADDDIRLLQCLVDQTLEELPDYQGPAENDVLLATLLERHKFPSGEPHRGHLHRIAAKDWKVASTKRAIIAEINSKSGHTGFDPAYYETKETFKVDAAACFKAHARNPKCGDYKTPSKELKPDTAAERKAAGIGKYDVAPASRRYLCEFCPVHSLVVSAANAKRLA